MSELIGKGGFQRIQDGVLEMGQQLEAAFTMEGGQVGGLERSVVERTAGLDEGACAGMSVQEPFDAHLEEQLIGQFGAVAPVWVGG